MRRILLFCLIFLTFALIVTQTTTASRGGLAPRAYMPVIFTGPSDDPPVDILPYLLGDGRLYEVRRSDGSQARHQTQGTAARFYHTKGSEVTAEWEELWADDVHIFRGTDTSPGNGLYYTLRDNGQYGSAWAPRFWQEGTLFQRAPLVQFFQKSDCSPVTGGVQTSWLEFVALHPNYTFFNGITVTDVIELAWLLTPEGAPVERYFYGRSYGLVGWWHPELGLSGISEEHAPGARPDNNREVIPCLNQDYLPDHDLYGLLPAWLGDHRR